MKHARKMVLVDINSTKSESTSAASEPISSNEKSDLVNAINSLASASEYNRTNFGSNYSTISQLNNELKVILDRTDITPDDKIKLYNQTLTRYLYLQRTNKPSSSYVDNTTATLSPATSTGSNWSLDVHSGENNETLPKFILPDINFSSPVNFDVTPTSSKSLNEYRILNEKTPLHQQQLQERPPSKFKSNLKRVTPKSQILRPTTLRQNEDTDYFHFWTEKKKKSSKKKSEKNE